jgi:hypothetical protein
MADSFNGVTLKKDTLAYKSTRGTVRGAQARVESAADAGKRLTATRLVAFGVFALALKKQTGHVFLTVEHPEYEFVVEVPSKKESEARKFAAKINTAARK